MQKPKLSFWQIWNMSFGFLGIQFGFALQNANVSRIFETLGANIDDIPILWIAAPVTGLLIQPIIGHMSDKTWNRFGRRRPYFLIGAIMASIALILMPNAPALWMAAGLLWILDASINISMEPFRAFVGDMLPDEQRTKGFAMQSFFIGIGAVVGSALPYMMTNWLGIANTAPEGIIPPSVKWSFYLGAAAFFTTVVWTVFRTKEYSPEQLAAFDSDDRKANFKAYEEKEAIQIKDKKNRKTKTNTGFIAIIIGLALSYIFYKIQSEKELYVLSFGALGFGFVFFLAGLMQKSGKTKNGFFEVIHDFFNMPRTMVELSFVQFFSWFALFAMWIYTTSAVTSHIYGTSDATSALFNEGADWVGFLFATYNGVAAAVAFLLPVMAKYTNRKITHLIALVLGGLGLISIYFFNDPNLLLISMIGIGFAWASILSMPYAILTGALPSHKMGVYMGIFNFFIVIPQIVAASILGFFTRHFFEGHAIYALVLGGISMIIAGLLTLLVTDKKG